jgi:pyrimidine operon attenuation protein/uracil phosphoribosyltransferase
MAPNKEAVLMDGEAVSRALVRITHEILERNKDTSNLALIGIHRGGSHLARRIHKIIQDIEKISLPIGFLDIAMYRDDFGEMGSQAILRGTEILFDVSQKTIILVDDVLFTGRTIRCAIDQIIDFGRPRQIQLAVLIDRGHRELPIRADFIGKNIPTSMTEEIRVLLTEDGEAEDQVIKQERGPKP